MGFLFPGGEKKKSSEQGMLFDLDGRWRDEILNREVFYSVKEAKVLVEDWRLE